LTKPSSYNNNKVEHKYSNDSNKYIVDNIPWEFEPKNAIRSIVPPAFMTLLPLRAYMTLRSVMVTSSSSSDNGGSMMNCRPFSSSADDLSGREVLIIPRLFMTLLSLLFLDGCLWALVVVNHTTTKGKDESSNTNNNSSSVGPPIEVIILASSWPMLVMGTRPFTNTLEAMVISLFLLIVALDHHHHHHSMSNNNNNNNNKISSFQHQNQTTIPLLVGMICSVGLFIRFTFAFFALPIVLLFLYNRWRASGYSWNNVGWNVLSLAISFLATSLVFVSIDWYYYHYLSPGRSADDNDDVTTCNNWSCHRDAFVTTASMYIVPWNAFRYNSKATNLAEHGLHPRITHVLVNLPMMFGPLSLLGYFSCIKMKKDHDSFFSSSAAAASGGEACFRRVLCQSTIICGLLVLSCAPHQEPRFLLPCIVPLVFLYGRKVVGIDNKQSPHSKQRVVALTALWVIFNCILYLFFGWLHQGGLISSLLHLPLPVNSHEGSPETVIYYKTYMPPTFLARGRSLGNVMEKGTTCYANDERIIVSEERDISLACDNQVIIDLQGREAEVLEEVLQERLPCPQRSDKSVLLVTPAPVMISLTEKEWREYTFLSVNGHRTHLSTEDWPVFNGTFRSFVDQLELVTYYFSCKVNE
jgi:phosphatidylinositol glycan class Z